MENIFELDFKNIKISYFSPSSRATPNSQGWKPDYNMRKKITWMHPWQPGEVRIMFYLLAIPAGHICDLFYYRLLGRTVPPAQSELYFDNSRLIEAQNRKNLVYPAFNTRFLCQIRYFIGIILVCICLGFIFLL